MKENHTYILTTTTTTTTTPAGHLKIEEIFKVAKETHIIMKGATIRLTAGF